MKKNSNKNTENTSVRVFLSMLKESIYQLGGRATRNQIIAFPAIYDGLVYIAVGEDPEHGEGVGHLWCLDPAHRINGADVSPDLAVDAASNFIPPRRLQAVNVKLGEGTVPNPDSAVCWHYGSQDRNANGKIEFEEQFGAVSCETQTIRGRWRSDGQSYRDDLIRVFVDAPDGTESREYFVAAKERLKARFQQLDIWLTTYLIEVL